MPSHPFFPLRWSDNAVLGNAGQTKAVLPRYKGNKDSREPSPRGTTWTQPGAEPDPRRLDQGEESRGAAHFLWQASPGNSDKALASQMLPIHFPFSWKSWQWFKANPWNRQEACCWPKSVTVEALPSGRSNHQLFLSGWWSSSPTELIASQITPISWKLASNNSTGLYGNHSYHLLSVYYGLSIGLGILYDGLPYYLQ